MAVSFSARSRGAGFLLGHIAPEDIVCPEDMGEDERLLMQSIKEFAEQEVEPVADQVDQRNIDVIRPLFKRAADLGIFMAEVPERHGGLELNLLAMAGMSECRSYLGGLSSVVFAHQGIGTLPLINFGTPAQIDKYLHGCMSGDLMAAFALTEAESGSDAMNIRTTAVLNAEGTHYIVNGSKQWITNAGWADLFILFAKVDATHFTAFLLERETPGLTVGGHERLLGLQGSSVCALQFTDVAIPIENVLGEIGKGHKVALCTLNLGRLKMAANCAGTAKKILVDTTAYACQRQQFGQPIAAFGLIQRKLADMAARAYGIESVAYRTAGLAYAGTVAFGPGDTSSLDRKLALLTEFSMECAMAKVIGSETYHGLADEAVQVFGGNGYSEEYPAARWYRDSRISRIYEGTSEICRLSIVKTLLKRSHRGVLPLRAAVAAVGTPDSHVYDASLESLKRQVNGFKQLFLLTLGQIWDRVDDAQLLGSANQQYLGSLADIAIETYLAESSILRVLKIQGATPEVDVALPATLARLLFYRAADRIRQEVTEVLTSLLDRSEAPAALSRVSEWLPVPEGLIATRTHAAEMLVARGGKMT